MQFDITVANTRFVPHDLSPEQPPVSKESVESKSIHIPVALSGSSGAKNIANEVLLIETVGPGAKHDLMERNNELYLSITQSPEYKEAKNRIQAKLDKSETGIQAVIPDEVEILEEMLSIIGGEASSFKDFFAIVAGQSSYAEWLGVSPDDVSDFVQSPQDVLGEMITQIGLYNSIGKGVKLCWRQNLVSRAEKRLENMGEGEKKDQLINWIAEQKVRMEDEWVDVAMSTSKGLMTVTKRLFNSLLVAYEMAPETVGKISQALKAMGIAGQALSVFGSVLKVFRQTKEQQLLTKEKDATEAQFEIQRINVNRGEVETATGVPEGYIQKGAAKQIGAVSKSMQRLIDMGEEDDNRKEALRPKFEKRWKSYTEQLTERIFMPDDKKEEIQEEMIPLLMGVQIIEIVLQQQPKYIIEEDLQAIQKTAKKTLKKLKKEITKQRRELKKHLKELLEKDFLGVNYERLDELTGLEKQGKLQEENKEEFAELKKMVKLEKRLKRELKKEVQKELKAIKTHVNAKIDLLQMRMEGKNKDQIKADLMNSKKILAESPSIQKSIKSLRELSPQKLVLLAQDAKIRKKFGVSIRGIAGVKEEDYSADFLSKKSIREGYLNRYHKHLQTLEPITKRAIERLVMDKQKQVQGMLNFDRTNTSLSLAKSIASIALGVGIMAFFPPVVVPYVGSGMAALGVYLSYSGDIHACIHNPNLVKEQWVYEPWLRNKVLNLFSKINAYRRGWAEQRLEKLDRKIEALKLQGLDNLIHQLEKGEAIPDDYQSQAQQFIPELNANASREEILPKLKKKSKEFRKILGQIQKENQHIEKLTDRVTESKRELEQYAEKVLNHKYQDYSLRWNSNDMDNIATFLPPAFSLLLEKGYISDDFMGIYKEVLGIDLKAMDQTDKEKFVKQVQKDFKKYFAQLKGSFIGGLKGKKSKERVKAKISQRKSKKAA